MNLKKILPFALILSLIPLVSARISMKWWYGYGPLEFLENEWVRFAILFLLFFAIIYYTTHKAFKGQKPVAAIVAAAISLFISMALSERGFLYGYGGDEISSWALIIGILLALGFLIKLAYEAFGPIGAVASVMLAWFLLYSIDPWEVYDLLGYNYNLTEIYEFIAGIGGLVIAIGICVLIIAFARKGEEEEGGYWVPTRRRKRRWW